MRLFCCGKGGWERLNLRASLVTLLLGCCLLTFLHFLIGSEFVDEAVYFSSLPLPPDPDLPRLGVRSVEDLPDSGPTRIPKIIHQTWKTDQIPSSLAGWVKSWTRNHPEWEYWLWTDASARRLIAERHPGLLATYDGYPTNIQRADALRYVVILEFGGVYADLDMESLRPLDGLARRYACFVGQEPYAHPILDTNTQTLVINALFGCRPGHPLLRAVVQSLPDFAHMWSLLDATGPHFLSLVFKLHRRRHPEFAATPDHPNATYLAPAEYFYPNKDPDKFGYFYSRCAGGYEALSRLQRVACQGLKATRPQGERMAMAFTDHHWIHTYLSVKVSLRRPVPVRELVPWVKIYADPPDR